MSFPLLRMRRLICLICALETVQSSALAPLPQAAHEPPAPPSEQQAQGEEAPRLEKDQLDSLVAPVALYPDPLLAQVLAASTYPLELVQLQQWLAQNKNLKEKALADAVKKQDWDPSVQAMAPLPDVVKRLTENIKWTTDLGNAFLAQQDDVMDAVQRMRVKAEEKGALKSDDKMTVEKKEVDHQSVVVIEQTNPEVIYVPTYNPTVVYGTPAYPYPPVYYPPAGAMFMSFTFGVAMGAAFSGGWGYNCGWSHANNVYVNNNNTFVRNSNARANRVAGTNRGAGNRWQHNPQHRGGAPYSNRNVANRYGGTTRGASSAQRQASARQNMARQPPSTRQAGIAGGGARTGNNQIGDRNVSTRSSGGGAFGGGSGGFSGGNAHASSARGGSSMRGGGGGGFRGGSRGGGRR